MVKIAFEPFVTEFTPSRFGISDAHLTTWMSRIFHLLLIPYRGSVSPVLVGIRTDRAQL